VGLIVPYTSDAARPDASDGAIAGTHTSFRIS
jgi:hypothetical protein